MILELAKRVAEVVVVVVRRVRVVKIVLLGSDRSYPSLPLVLGVVVAADSHRDLDSVVASFHAYYSLSRYGHSHCHHHSHPGHRLQLVLRLIR